MNIMNCTCEYCGQLHHIPGCPNYREYKSNIICAECGEEICIGDKYVRNDVGQSAHVDCFDRTEDMAIFLSYRIYEMTEDDYGE